MQVKATKLGYYDLKRRKPGAVFDMDPATYAPKDKNGKPLVYKEGHPKAGEEKVCLWVELVEPLPKAKAQADVKQIQVPMKKIAKPTGDAEVI